MRLRDLVTGHYFGSLTFVFVLYIRFADLYLAVTHISICQWTSNAFHACALVHNICFFLNICKIMQSSYVRTISSAKFYIVSSDTHN